MQLQHDNMIRRRMYFVVGRKNVAIRLAFLTQYWSVAGGRTDRRTGGWILYCCTSIVFCTALHSDVRKLTQWSSNSRIQPELIVQPLQTFPHIQRVINLVVCNRRSRLITVHDNQPTTLFTAPRTAGIYTD